MSFNKLRNTDLPGAAAGLAPDVPWMNMARFSFKKRDLRGNSNKHGGFSSIFQCYLDDQRVIFSSKAGALD